MQIGVVSKGQGQIPLPNCYILYIVKNQHLILICFMFAPWLLNIFFFWNLQLFFFLIDKRIICHCHIANIHFLNIVLVFVRGVCNFLGSVSPQQKFEETDRPVLQLSFVSKQRKIHPRGVRVGWPKRHTEKRSPQLNFGSFFCFSLLSLSLSYVNWPSQEDCLFYLRFSLWSLDIPLFYFYRLFPSLYFSQHHFGLIFPILTT